MFAAGIGGIIAFPALGKNYARNQRSWKCSEITFVSLTNSHSLLVTAMSKYKYNDIVLEIIGQIGIIRVSQCTPAFTPNR